MSSNKILQKCNLEKKPNHQSNSILLNMALAIIPEISYQKGSPWDLMLFGVNYISNFSKWKVVPRVESWESLCVWESESFSGNQNVCWAILCVSKLWLIIFSKKKNHPDFYWVSTILKSIVIILMLSINFFLYFNYSRQIVNSFIVSSTQ